MQTLQYLYDATGNPTAMYVDLKNSKVANVLKKPFNKSQIEILEMLSVSEDKEYLSDLKQTLAEFLMNKIINHTTKIWDEKGYTKETFEKFVEND